MATLPTLPTEYNWPAMPTDFSGWNQYSPASAADLRSLLYGNDVVGVGQIDRSSKNCVVWLEPAQGSIDRYLTNNTNSSYPYFFNGQSSAITTGQSTYWILLMPKESAYTNFLARFPEGIRIDEELYTNDGVNLDGTYGALMPLLSNEGYAGDTIRIGFGVKKIRLVGLHISHDAATLTYNCVNLSCGETSDSDYASISAELAEEIVIDRCVVRPDRSAAASTFYVRGIAANANKVAIVDSAITEWRSSSDTNAIHIFNGVSQVITENCLLISTGENWFTQGTTIPMGYPYVPSDLVVRGNLFRKLPQWNFNSDLYDSNTGIYACKNLLETKSGDKILIEGNVFDHHFADAQSETVVLKNVNQISLVATYAMHPSINTQIKLDVAPFTVNEIGNKINVTAGGTPGWYEVVGFSDPYAILDSSPAAAGTTGITAYRGRMPWVYTHDLTMRYNYLARAPGIFALQYANIDGYPSNGARRWHIHDNLLIGLQHDQSYIGTPTRYSMAIAGTSLEATYPDPDEQAMTDFVIEHNALLHVGIAKFTNYSHPVGSACFTQSIAIPGAGDPQYGTDYVNRYNILDTCYFGAVFRNSTAYGTPSMNASYDSYTWGPNVQIGTQSNSPASYGSPANQPSTYFADTYGDVGFTDWAAMDFELTSAGTNGDYRAGQAQEAGDGKDMGPDHDEIKYRRRAAQDGRRGVKRRLRIRV